ncbi:MAG: CopD family protein [Thaumarchaeota archaeon]|nr:CopD family protein [Nitrososphaerota archaeon]
MAIEYAIITWIHLIAASIWLGGSIFIGVVMAPILKEIFDSQKRLQIMIKIGKRFNKIAMPAFVILIITGIYKAHPFLTAPDIMFTTNYGYLLLIKIILVVLLALSFIIHIKMINNELLLSKQNDLQIQNLRKKIVNLGKLILFISVIIFFIASLLDEGL